MAEIVKTIRTVFDPWDKHIRYMEDELPNPDNFLNCNDDYPTSTDMEMLPVEDEIGQRREAFMKGGLGPREYGE